MTNTNKDGFTRRQIQTTPDMVRTREEVIGMQITFGRRQFWLLVLILIIAGLASTVTVRTVDYIRDHNDMREELIQKDEIIELLEENTALTKEQKEALKDENEELKNHPLR